MPTAGHGEPGNAPGAGGLSDRVRLTADVREPRARLHALVGRERELQQLIARITLAIGGRGGVLLVAGEAGIGKSALIDRAVASCVTGVYRGATTMHGPSPYAPIAAALREAERAATGVLAGSGPLACHLSRILPELGAPCDSSDRVLLADALKDAFRGVGQRGAAVVLIDDLQWADEATLEFLPLLVPATGDIPLLVVVSYRSDEVHRGHGLRRMRAELRRARSLDELVLEPLAAAETTELVETIIGRRVSDELSAVIFDKTGGLPFFIEEITAALIAGNHLMTAGDPVALASGKVPLPETVRDAVRIRTDRLSDAGRAAIELASVAGQRDLASFFDAAHEKGLEEALALGILRERENGVTSFRHALVREGIYADIPWTRRRAYHRRVAEMLEQRGERPEAIAEHWAGAREPERAAAQFMEAARAFCAVGAYRDAAQAGRRALELWPHGSDDAGRLAALEQFGHCAEMSSDLAEAASAWEEVRDAHVAADESERLGDIARRLAGIYEMQGMPERTRAAREQAAAAFETCGRIADAVTERLAIAERLELAGSGVAALAIVTGLSSDIAHSGSLELRIRALALEGELRAKLGERAAGLACSREALSLALEHGETASTAEAYYRLGAALENACEHDAAVAAYTTARGFCLGKRIDALAQVCFACMLPALLLTGQWSRTQEVAHTVLESPDSPPVARAKANLHLGIVAVLRGHTVGARKLMEETYAFSQQHQFVPIEVFSAWGLSRVADLTGQGDEAAERLREVLRRAVDRTERHYSVPVLRWASTFFARRSEVREVGECANLLSQIAAATGHPECLGPLAHALGELALANGDAPAAVQQFEQALRLMSQAGIPYEGAETQLRAGVALIAAGRKPDAVEQLTEAYRTARRFGARPLAQKIADTMTAIGEPVERRMGRRAAEAVDGGGLSAREADVLRLVADGLTNRQIGTCLFISKRTVDMHMRNVLSRLGCRSRIEAVTRARSLQILR